jgi:hypothetical protein
MTQPAAPVRPTTFFREIDHNRRSSIVLVAIVVVLLGALGGAIGYATGFGWGGVIVAVIVASLMSVGSYFAGDALVLASAARRCCGCGDVHVWLMRESRTRPVK